MRIHQKKYTDLTKNLFSVLRVMSRTEHGTVLKVLLYLYSIHPGHATKTHIAKQGRFDPTKVGKYLDLAVERQYITKTKRTRMFAGFPVVNDSYILSRKGIEFVNESLDPLELK